MQFQDRNNPYTAAAITAERSGLFVTYFAQVVILTAHYKQKDENQTENAAIHDGILPRYRSFCIPESEIRGCAEADVGFRVLHEQVCREFARQAGGRLYPAACSSAVQRAAQEFPANDRHFA